MAETSAYWTQWFYQDLMREREQLERSYKANAGITTSREDAAAQAEARKGITRRYNVLGRILGLPEEDPEAEVEEARRSAERKT